MDGIRQESNMKTIAIGVAVGVVVAGMAVFVPASPAAEPSATLQPAQTDAPADPLNDPATAVSAVKRALANERLSSEISVSSHASTVVLTGKVASEAESARVQSVAQKAAGGLRVSARLEVPETTSTAVPASAQLVRDVEAALRNDPRTADLGVTVSIDEQQTIGLHGLVPSSTASATAQSVASKTRGVKKVSNHLQTPTSPR
jgi:osmotically-inducible protein OsmY